MILFFQVIDLKTQLKYYKREIVEVSHKIGNGEAARILSTAVYLFSIGTNDYMSPFLLNSSIPHSNYVHLVLGNLSTVVEVSLRIRSFINLGSK